MNYLILIIVGIAGIAIGRHFSHKQNLISKQAEQKIENKKKVLQLFQSKEKVVNNDIENLLGVSDSTVTRYLEELEKEQKVRQIGETGQGVYYVLK